MILICSSGLSAEVWKIVMGVSYLLPNIYLLLFYPRVVYPKDHGILLFLSVITSMKAPTRFLSSPKSLG